MTRIKNISLTLVTYSTAAFLAAGLALVLNSEQARSETTTDMSADNKAVILESFDAWAEGTGGPYDLLADSVQWTITGRSAAARTYPSREAFMSEVIRPFSHARAAEAERPRDLCRG